MEKMKCIQLRVGSYLIYTIGSERTTQSILNKVNWYAAYNRALDPLDIINSIQDGYTRAIGTNFQDQLAIIKYNKKAKKINVLMENEMAEAVLFLINPQRYCKLHNIPDQKNELFHKIKKEFSKLYDMTEITERLPLEV